MKTMQLCSLLFAATLILPSAMSFAAVTSNDAKKILDLISGKDEKAFCAKGASFLIKTIRSFEGNLCVPQMGAALALGVCEGVGDFEKSQCYNKAITTLKAEFPDVKDASYRAALTVIAKNPRSACETLQQILPKLYPQCLQIVQSLQR